MEPISAALLAKSLDGLAMRMDVTAANIANAGSRGFRASRVTFEDSLRSAAAHGPAAIAAVTPRVEAAAGARFADEPRTDLDLDTAAATAGRYSAMVEIMARELDIARTAIAGGR